jgi:hypothetical protein
MGSLFLAAYREIPLYRYFFFSCFFSVSIIYLMFVSIRFFSPAIKLYVNKFVFRVAPPLSYCHCCRYGMRAVSGGDKGSVVLFIF